MCMFCLSSQCSPEGESVCVCMCVCPCQFFPATPHLIQVRGMCSGNYQCAGYSVICLRILCPFRFLFLSFTPGTAIQFPTPPHHSFQGMLSSNAISPPFPWSIPPPQHVILILHGKIRVQGHPLLGRVLWLLLSRFFYLNGRHVLMVVTYEYRGEVRCHSYNLS